MSGKNKGGRPPVHTPQAGRVAAQQPRQMVQGQTTTLISHSVEIASPYPPPELLRGYNEVIPGLADKLIQWTEDESRHRRALDLKRLNWANGLDLAGLVVAGGLCVMFALLAWDLLRAGKSAEGLVAMVAAVVPLAGAFFVARRRK